MTDALWSIASIAVACVLASIVMLEVTNGFRLSIAIGRYLMARVRRHITECRTRR